MSSGSRHSMRYVRELVRGTTPATPIFKPLRITGTSLGLSKETLQSEEIRDDRHIVDVRHGSFQTAGDVNFELSYGTFDDMLEAALMGTWAVAGGGAGIDRLKAGIIRRYHTMERYFGDISDKPYHRYRGVEVNTMELSVNANSMITGSFGLIGADLATAAAAIAGSTYPAPSTTSPLDSFTGSLLEDGVAIATITEISLSLANNLEARYVVGSKASILPSVGRSNVSGNVSVFFEDNVMYDKFINETESELEFNLPDAAGNNIRFWMPRIKYNGGQPDVDGEGDITLSMPFQALYDATAGSNLVIDRNPA